MSCMFRSPGSAPIKVGSLATFLLAVRFGGSGSTGRHIRSVTPPRTYPRRKPFWSAL
ncbi:hypothetical protein B296_00057266 [Ensete ventricosum]|uniref:Uncharacterized protein n=1 Tax=Ensete ventricosum TaxID=4639 RepID=A0A426X0I2_ENSVE|nr:hypothetical protein B296_00057266 [Ensete ventricosum]